MSILIKLLRIQKLSAIIFVVHFFSNPRHSLRVDYKSIELVFFHELCFAGVFSLWKLYKRRGPVKVYFFRATQLGLKLAKLFVLLRILKKEPVRINNLSFIDTPDCRFWSHLAKATNAGKEKSPEIEKIISAIFQKETRNFQHFLAFNIRKSWEPRVAELMHLCLLAQLEANQRGLPLKKVVVFSSSAVLFNHWELKKEFPGIVLRDFFEIKNFMYNLGALFLTLRSFFELIVKHSYPVAKYDSKIELARFGVGAAWGTKRSGRASLDDLFWWRKSNLSGDRVVYLYDRVDLQPRFSEVKKLNSLGIQSAAMNPRLVGNCPQLYCDPRHKKFFSQIICDLIRTIKLAFKSISREPLKRQIISQINWRLCKSIRLASAYKFLNLKGVFHHDEVGFDNVTLASRLAGGVRIGTHWSCFNGVCEVNRSHDVFFIWGKHDAKIIQDSGSVSKHLLISGCISAENSKKIAYEKAEVVANKMRRQGVKYLVSLFDSSVPVPNFYDFFLRWLLEDPCLGILIKPKGDFFLKEMEDELKTLFDRALETGRICLLDYDASPADAGRVSDFSVGIGSLSAVVVAALNGARIFYVDYERMDQGAPKQYCTLHSLGENRCVFYDPESLKRAVLEYVDNPEINPCLGDVSPILDEFDSFRDGKAGERIGEYISWYLEGLDNNLDKDTALQKATQKYAAKWGAEKVISKTPV